MDNIKWSLFYFIFITRCEAGIMLETGLAAPVD